MAASACQVDRTPRPQVINADSALAVDVGAARDGYTEAVLAGDARRAGSFFTADARLYSSYTQDVIGSDAIRRVLQDAFGSSEVTDMTMEAGTIDVVNDSTAYEIGTFSETYRIDEDGSEAVNGRYMIRWQLQPQAVWRIQTMMLNHLPPDSVASP